MALEVISRRSIVNSFAAVFVNEVGRYLLLLATVAATASCYEHTTLREPPVIEDCGWDGSPAPEGQALALGSYHTCALSSTGTVRCWGDYQPCHDCEGEGTGYTEASGILGYGNREAIGDDETPASAGDVDIGGPVKQITAGGSNTCALLESGEVRCWGSKLLSDDVIGDDETPASEGNVDVGGPVKQIAMGSSHTCTLLESGSVRCWGIGDFGHLGYGNPDSIGDDETPASAGDVDVGGPVKQIAAGAYHTCALLESGAVRCWGSNEIVRTLDCTAQHSSYETSFGVLGYGYDTGDIGDDETPASVGDVDVGGPVRQIAAGYEHTCALLESGAVRCWGNNYVLEPCFNVGRVEVLGVLGNESDERVIGDDETPAEADEVFIGEPVVSLSAGWHATCAVLESGRVRCWGLGIFGQLGYGNTRSIGNNETPARAGDVPLGCSAWQVLTGGYGHTCAFLRNGSVRCWGANGAAQLGHYFPEKIGDDETPESAGDVPVW
jgi:alpha-tubulin suppressor-like RCC1 family protein